MAQQNLDIILRVRGGQVVSQEVQRVAGSIRGMGTASQQTSSKSAMLKNALGGIATGVAVYKGFGIIKGAVTDTANLAKSTAGLQRVTGLDTQTAAGWVMLAKQRGVETKALNQSFITLSKQLVSASSGGKAATAAFDKLGLSAGQLKGMNTQQQLGAIADAFNRLPPGADRSAIASQLFGRQAQAMLPILSQGSGALNEQVGALGRQSGMTGQSQKQALALVAAQRQWQAATTQVKSAIAIALLPVLQSLITIFMPLIQGFASLMQSSGAFRVMVVAVTGALATYVVAMQIAKLANLAFMATAAPWLALGAAIVLLFVQLYQRCAWFRDIVNAAFGLLKTVAVSVFNWIKGNWPLLLTILGGPIGAAIAGIVTHFNTIKSVASSVFNSIRSVVSSAWGVLQSVGGWIGSVFAGAWNTVKSAVQGVVNTIQTMINTAKQVSSLPGKVLGALTGGLLGGQHGLYMSSGGARVVGEYGPEMVTLPQGAAVHPFMTRSAGGGGGGRVVVPVYLDKRQIALAMGAYTADEQAAR